MTRKQEDYASTLEGVHSQPKEILEIMATTKSATTESIERDRDSPNHGLWWPFPIKQGFNIWTVAFCGIFALSTPASGQILWKGMAVATNFSGTCTPDNQCVVDPLGHVIAVIEIRNKTSAGIKPGRIGPATRIIRATFSRFPARVIPRPSQTAAPPPSRTTIVRAVTPLEVATQFCVIPRRKLHPRTVFFRPEDFRVQILS